VCGTCGELHRIEPGGEWVPGPPESTPDPPTADPPTPDPPTPDPPTLDQPKPAEGDGGRWFNRIDISVGGSDGD